MAKPKPFFISENSARKMSRVLMSKLGQPEGGDACCDHWGTEWQSTWRYRHDDGTTWARMGYGPTRKMVTLSERTDKTGKKTFRFWVHICTP